MLIKIESGHWINAYYLQRAHVWDSNTAVAVCDTLGKVTVHHVGPRPRAKDIVGMLEQSSAARLIGRVQTGGRNFVPSSSIVRLTTGLGDYHGTVVAETICGHVRLETDGIGSVQEQVDKVAEAINRMQEGAIVTIAQTPAPPSPIGTDGPLVEVEPGKWLNVLAVETIWAGVHDVEVTLRCGRPQGFQPLDGEAPVDFARRLARRLNLAGGIS